MINYIKQNYNFSEFSLKVKKIIKSIKISLIISNQFWTVESIIMSKTENM